MYYIPISISYHLLPPYRIYVMEIAQSIFMTGVSNATLFLNIFCEKNEPLNSASKLERGLILTDRPPTTDHRLHAS